MHDIESMIPPIAQMLGIEPATALLFLGVIVALANLLGRLIPDDKTGILGLVRSICKVVGLYASNRIASGLTVNKIAETTAPIVEELDQRIEDVAGVIKAFPGLPARGPDGKFLPRDSK